MRGYMLILAVVLVGTKSFSQDPRLFEEFNWNLIELTLFGNELDPPPWSYDNEFGWALAAFSEESNGTYQLFLNCCDNQFAEIFFDPEEPAFTIFGWGNFPYPCKNQNYQSFASLYFQFYEENTPGPLTYEIIDEGNGGMSLLITAPNGDFALYGNDVLSNQIFARSDFTIYPNPVSDELFIASEKNVVDKTTVYSFSGQQLLSSQGQIKSLDVSSLSEGMYLLEILSEGKSQIQKFVKH